jgi:protein-disulfide isomerase
MVQSGYEKAWKRKTLKNAHDWRTPVSKLSFPWLLAIVAVSAVTVAALLVWLSQTSGGGEEEIQEILAAVPQDGKTLGAEDAPVTVYLYEDLQCPACARFSRETLPDLIARYVEPGTAKIVAEPIAILGPDSVPAAEAADAAGEQDRFWEYSTLFYLNQGAENSGYDWGSRSPRLVWADMLACCFRPCSGVKEERYSNCSLPSSASSLVPISRISSYSSSTPSASGACLAPPL